MKRTILWIFSALVLTVPIYVLIATNGWVRRWTDSDAGLDALRPLFRLVGSVGGEQNEDVIVATLLVASFVIALGLTLLVGRLFLRAKTPLQQ